MTENEIAKIIVNSAYQVHNELGPGLLESVYEKCLTYELINEGLYVNQQEPIPVTYKGIKVDCGFRLDLLINKKLIVEVKAVDSLNDVHLAQMLTYLKLTDCKLGILVNFNVKYIKNGLKRVINGELW